MDVVWVAGCPKTPNPAGFAAPNVELLLLPNIDVLAAVLFCVPNNDVVWGCVCPKTPNPGCVVAAPKAGAVLVLAPNSPPACCVCPKRDVVGCWPKAGVAPNAPVAGLLNAVVWPNGLAAAVFVPNVPNPVLVVG